jgi:hypothetical protein
VDHAVAILGRAVLAELALSLDRLNLERERSDVGQQPGDLALASGGKSPWRREQLLVDLDKLGQVSDDRERLRSCREGPTARARRNED